MANEPILTIVGNLVDDPALRFTPSGAAVANFTVASTPRTLNKQTNEWDDGETMFMSCSIWRQPAENVAESLQKGMRVIVHGRLRARSYDARDGSRRTVFEVDVDEVGPSLRYATARVARTTSSTGDRGARPQASGPDPLASSGNSPAAAAAQDPWQRQTNYDDTTPPF